jgi:hypothetical protein
MEIAIRDEGSCFCNIDCFSNKSVCRGFQKGAENKKGEKRGGVNASVTDERVARRGFRR